MNIVAMITNARKKMEKFLDEVNRTLPLLRTAGLSVKDIDVEMGLLPSVRLVVIGSIRQLDPVKIRHLRESHKDNRALSAVLRAVETALNLKGLLGALVADAIEVQATLGLLFGVKVRFIPADSVGRVNPEVVPDVADQLSHPSATLA
jgi:hypothetical protein